MIGLIRRLFRDENGVTSVEYGLLTAILCLAVIVAYPIVSESWISFTTALGAVFAGALS